MGRSRDDAAYADNWRRVIAADAAIGAGGVGGGLVLAFALRALVIGAGLAALGFLYLAAVARRTQRWRQLRNDAGL